MISRSVTAEEEVSEIERKAWNLTSENGMWALGVDS